MNDAAIGSAASRSRASRLAGGVLAWLLSMLLSGCASEGPKILHFGVGEGPGRGMTWPAQPEVPRYIYAGELIGEGNLRPAEGQKTNLLRDALIWIAGLLDAPPRPVVLQRPQTGFVGAGKRIMITDSSRQGVFVFDPVAGSLSVFDRAEPRSDFVNPVGIAEAPDGEILVADAELAIVARLAPDGEPRAPIGRGRLTRPTGLAVDRISGRIFVADTHAHDIKVFDRSGVLLSTWGQRGERAGEFNYPTHLTFVSGELYVTDTMNSRVQILDGATGTVRRMLGERGLFIGNLVRPKGVAVDSQGNVYVIESYYDHLLIYDKRGTFLMGIGGVGKDAGRFFLPSGVWVDEHDRVFVSDTFNGRVALFQFLGGDVDGEM